MSVIGFVVRTAVIAGCVIVGQRLWDARQLEELHDELRQLESTLRRDRNRVGSLKGNFEVAVRDIRSKYAEKIQLAHTLVELDRQIAVHIASLIEPTE